MFNVLQMLLKKLYIVIYPDYVVKYIKLFVIFNNKIQNKKEGHMFILCKS